MHLGGRRGIPVKGGRMLSFKGWSVGKKIGTNSVKLRCALELNGKLAKEGKGVRFEGESERGTIDN